MKRLKRSAANSYEGIKYEQSQCDLKLKRYVEQVIELAFSGVLQLQNQNRSAVQAFVILKTMDRR